MNIRCMIHGEARAAAGRINNATCTEYLQPDAPPSRALRICESTWLLSCKQHASVAVLAERVSFDAQDAPNGNGALSPLCAIVGMPLEVVKHHGHRVAVVDSARGGIRKNLPFDIVIVPAIGVQSFDHNGITPHVTSDKLYGRFLFTQFELTHLYYFTYYPPSAHTERDIFERHASHLLESVQQMQDRTGRKPIHFVGHSTGGLIVKKAVVLAHQNPKYAKIATSCFSIAFFGVPHRGSSILSEAPFARSIKSELKLVDEMPNALRDVVAPENDTIRLLAYDFLPVSRRLQKIWTFIETEDTVLTALASSYDAGDTRVELRFPIVDARSATLHVGNETIIRLSRSHAQLLGVDTREILNPFIDYIESLEDLLSTLMNNTDDLNTYIRKAVAVDLHLFYNASQVADETSIKVWSVYPELGTLLDVGPTECFKARLRQPEPEPDTPTTQPEEQKTTAADLLIRPPTVRRGSTTNMQVVGEEAPPSSIESWRMNIPTIEVRPPTPPPDEAPPTKPVDAIQKPPPKSFYAEYFGPQTSENSSESEHELQDVDSIQFKDSFSNEPIPPVLVVVDQPRDRIVPKNTERPSTDRRASLTVEYKPFKDPQLYQVYQRRAFETFQLPDKRRRRFQWAHLPFNVMGWVPELMQSLAREDPQPKLHETLLHESNFDSNQNVARHGKPHSRFMIPGCKSFEMTKETPGLTTKTTRMSIFLPYLHWDSFDSLVKRSEVIELRFKQRHPYPVNEKVRQGHSTEHKVIWQYLIDSINAPVHHRRSLDQYGYPSLMSTDARDRDQILYKRRSKTPQQEAHDSKHGKKKIGNQKPLPYEEKSSNSADERLPRETGKVLMVDQLWCWILDDSTILTLFPSKESDPQEKDGTTKPADLRNSIYNDVNGDPRFATQSQNVFDFAALIVSHAVRVFLESKLEEDLQVFRVFEEYISLLTERHTSSFKTFQQRYGEYRQLRKDPYRNADKLSGLQEADLQANEEDLTAMLELRDVEDELNTIARLFRDQDRVLSSMLEQYSDGRSVKGTELLNETRVRIKNYEVQVKEMQSHCKSAQEAFTGLLDMKQRQANLAEAWAAREATELASGQSRAVLIFTIFTIIFLPLSFFTSFFGMNVRSWSSDDQYVPMHQIILWMFPISTVVTVVALLIAFNDSVRQTVVWFIRLVLDRTRRRRRRKKESEDVESGKGFLGMPMRRHDLRSGLQMVNTRGSIMGGPVMGGLQWKGFSSQVEKLGEKDD